MGVEIERKYRVSGDGWRETADEGTSIVQGYLSLDPDRTVRARRSGEGHTLTVKGRGDGASRPEIELEVPEDEIDELLALSVPPLIEKTRYRVDHDGEIWEVDVFEGENEGLVLAEVELEDEGDEPDVPEWAGEDVTGRPEFFNSALVEKPYRQWREGDER